MKRLLIFALLITVGLLSIPTTLTAQGFGGDMPPFGSMDGPPEGFMPRGDRDFRDSENNSRNRTNDSVLVKKDQRRIIALLRDRDTKEALEQAAVQLLRTDSSFVAGAVSDEYGIFSVTAPEDGMYLLRISSVGYTAQLKKIVIEDCKNLDLGEIVMNADAVMLKGVTATAQALKVVMVEDTFIYNSAAYRVPEGSAVEELIRLIPGATIDDDGNVTINGKQVKKIKMDGKEFMTGDTQTALKNLPTAIVEKVKAYEEKSDRARITGIDDGEEEMTLDFTIKQGMNKGVLGNIDASYGTRDRYSEKLMLALFKSDFRMMSFANFNNVNDAGFGGRGGGMGRGRDGLNTSDMVGVNFNYEKTKVLKWDGSVRWNHNTSNQYTKTSSESFVIGNQSFSNSLSQQYSKNKSWNAQMRIEWTPDTMTNILLRPSFSWSDSDGRGGSASASFDEDPYGYVADPLGDISALETLGIVKNSRDGSSLSYSDSKRVTLWFQVNRKLNSSGRNIAISGDLSYSSANSKSFSTSNVELQQADSAYSINRYNLTPSTDWSYNVQLSYSEPIAKKTYLQFSYKYSHSYSKSDRATYDFSDLSSLSADYVNLLASLGIGSIPRYRYWGGYLPDNYEGYKDESLSRFSEYRTDTHDIEVQFRRVRDNYNLNFGVLLQPQQTNFVQKYLGTSTDTTRNVLNISPTADFRYYFSRQHQLRFRYRGTTSQPSMAQMVQIEDNSDPMNITVGNPGLKPAFTNNLNFNYHNFILNHYQVISARGSFSNTRNKTVESVIYDDETGASTRRYENINGNWDASLGGEYIVAVDTAGVWYLSNSADYSYNHNVGLVSLDLSSSSQRNVTNVHNITDRLAASYRNEWLNVELDGSVTYTHSKNQLQPTANLDTWAFSYGTNLQITCPWGTSLSSDIHMKSRRGYSDASLNTNELVWNAQLSQGFLKGKALTVSLQWYDILDKQSNLSRTISSLARTDTEYNAINSYGMLHVIYRFNIFAGRSSQEGMGPEGRDGRRPDFSRDEFRNRGGNQGRGMGGPPPGGGFGGPM